MADHVCGEFAFGDNRDLHLTAAERARGLKLERAFRAALAEVAGKVMARYHAHARESLSASVTGITPGGLYDDSWWLDAVDEYVADPYREVINDVARSAIRDAAGAKVAASFDVENPWLDQVAADRLDAIDRWSATQKNWVTDQVMKGLKNGWGVDDLAAKLSAGPLDDGANAQRIAQNQLIGASNGASVAAWQSYGFDGATKIWACLPGNAKVSALECSHISRRRYAGHFVVLVTAGGGVLTVTPNHTVLTPRGWVRADQVHPGDGLIRHAFADVVNALGPDIERQPAMIGEAFSALDHPGAGERMVHAGFNLDGDGGCSEVDVVLVDSELRQRLQASLSEPFANLFLEHTDESLIPLAKLCASDQDFVRHFPSPVEFLCDSDPLPLTGVERYAEFSGSGLAPQFDTPALHGSDHCGIRNIPSSSKGPNSPTGLVEVDDLLSPGFEVGVNRGDSFGEPQFGSRSDLVEGFRTGEPLAGGVTDTHQGVDRPQSPTNGFGATPNFSTDFLRRSSGFVQLDEVVEVRRDVSTGHVYDLSTAGHWYVADGFIVHNSAGDSRVRPSHEEADGQEVALDEPFEVGGELGMFPGDDSLNDEAENCRCTVMFNGAGNLDESGYENAVDSGDTASISQPDSSAFDGAPISDGGDGLDSYVADDNGDSFAASAAGAAKEAPVAEATLVADNAAEPDVETPSTATWEFGGYKVLHPGQSCDNRYEVVDKDGNSQGCHKYLRDAKKHIKDLEEKDSEASVARAEQARSEEPHADALAASVEAEELAVDPANPAGSPVDDTTLPGEGEAGPVQPWSGILVQEGIDTGDNRRIAPGALVWEALPHPLMVMLENPEGGGGHDGAALGGRIDGYTREGGAVVGNGVFDLTGETGSEAVRLMRLGMIRGVSVDLDDIEYEFDGGDEIDYMMGNATIVFTKARIRGATVTPFPAFIGAEIQLVDDTADDVALVAGSGGGGFRYPTRAVANTQIEGWGMPDATLVASVVGDIVDSPALRLPPVSAFTRRTYKEFRPFSLDSDGFGEGHIARWGECHIGFQDRCVPLPKSNCGYGYARTGHVLCEGNELVPTARVFFKTTPQGGSHAPRNLNAEAAEEWYENTCCVGMDVALYDDEFGIQMVGRIRPGITKLQEIALRASDFSPDWRTWPRQFKLQAIAVAAVNVSGSPSRYERLPALAASAVEAGFDVDPTKVLTSRTVLEGHVANGELVTLVASPVGQSKRASAVSLLADQVSALQAQVDDLKAALLPIRRERALAALDTGRKPIRAESEV